VRRPNTNGRTIRLGLSHQSSRCESYRSEGMKRLALRPLGPLGHTGQPKRSRAPADGQRLVRQSHPSQLIAGSTTPWPACPLRMGVCAARHAASKPQWLCPIGAACMSQPANRPSPHHAHHNRPRTVSYCSNYCVPVYRRLPGTHSSASRQLAERGLAASACSSHLTSRARRGRCSQYTNTTWHRVVKQRLPGCPL
jgi:hypothetical protein